MNSDVIYKSTEKTNCWGWPGFISWGDLMKDYVINDTLNVEIHVKIKTMTGINLRSFNESAKEFSDAVLVVENKKFYVSKLFLASLSPFFKSTLLKLSETSEEHTLQDVKAVDFQKLLELLHGENPIEDSTIDGILYLADMYGTKIAIEKCEQFLVQSSEKPMKEKLKLAHRYKLKSLKNHCLSTIKLAQIRSVLTDDLSGIDTSVVEELMRKFMANQEKTSKDLSEKNEKTLFLLMALFVFVLCVLFSLFARMVIG